MSVHIVRPTNVSDPDFSALSAAWANEMISEMEETILLTKSAIAESRTLMARADRLLGRK
jgi:hypothetical protein